MRDRIETDRLKLRPPQPDDAAVMALRINDPDILRMTGTLPYPYFRLSADFWITRAQSNRKCGTSYAYAIEENDSGMIGVIDLFKNSEDNWEIGYWLAKPWWGKGLISEAAIAIITEAFLVYNIDFIHAGHFADNPASCRVLQKLGFVRHGEPIKFFSVARGASFDSLEYRLYREAFQSQHTAQFTN